MNYWNPFFSLHVAIGEAITVSTCARALAQMETQEKDDTSYLLAFKLIVFPVTFPLGSCKTNFLVK